MAYNTDELKAKALTIIEEKKIFFFTHLIAHLGIASSTFYDHFPSNSSDYKEMDELIEKNKVDIKTAMMNKWFKSGNATLQISLMKMLATDEERKKLSQVYTDITSDNKPIEPMSVDLSKLSKDALKEIAKSFDESTGD